MFRDLVLGCVIVGCLVVMAAAWVLAHELGLDVSTNRKRTKRHTTAPEAGGCEVADSHRPDGGARPDGPREGRVLAVLRPRGLVVVDGVAEPAHWRGPGDAPARDGTVLLSRSAAVDGWLAWLLTGPEPVQSLDSPSAPGPEEVRP